MIKVIKKLIIKLEKKKTKKRKKKENGNLFVLKRIFN